MKVFFSWSGDLSKKVAGLHQAPAKSLPARPRRCPALSGVAAGRRKSASIHALGQPISQASGYAQTSRLSNYLDLAWGNPKAEQPDTSRPAPSLGNGKIVAYMKAVYLNSQFYSVSERMRFFSRDCKKEWKAVWVRLEGPRIYLGNNPYLVASKVHDLRTERDASSGDEIVRWTQVPGFSRPPDYAIKRRQEEPVERVFLISGHGTIVTDLKAKN